MIQKLETLFADWPFQGQTPPPIPTNTTFAASGVYLVNKDVNQGRVAMMLPGIMRDNPDYFAVAVMNDILGGGGLHLAHHEPRALGRRPGLRRPLDLPGRRLLPADLHRRLPDPSPAPCLTRPRWCWRR